MCDLVFIVVHDEEKSDVSISRLYLDGTGSCCLASTIVITDIRIAACEILPVRKKDLLTMGKGELCLRRGEEPRSALYVLSPCIHCAKLSKIAARQRYKMSGDGDAAPTRHVDAEL